MTNSEKIYFDWLCEQVGAGPRTHYQGRRRLLEYLFRKPYWYRNLLDQNRKVDAEDMQIAFEEEHHITLCHIPGCLDVMVALCIRMERDIVGSNDPNQLSRWFVDMLRGLELYNMVDASFDPEQADIFADQWIAGERSLFEGPEEIRNYDIWYQVQYYLNNILF